MRCTAEFHIIIFILICVFSRYLCIYRMPYEYTIVKRCNRMGEIAGNLCCCLDRYIFIDHQGCLCTYNEGIST